MTGRTISAYGGPLVELYADAATVRQRKTDGRSWLSWDLTARQQCDLELLLSGAYSPLRGFMGAEAHRSVCETMRLPDGLLWPLPVTLDVPEVLAQRLAPGTPLALRDAEGVLLAVLTVEDRYRPDRGWEAECLYGTADLAHPEVAHLLRRAGDWCVGGTVEGVEPPIHRDFPTLRPTPATLRSTFAERGWESVVALQPTDLVHRPIAELVQRISEQERGGILLHPAVGLPAPGDPRHYARVRAWKAVVEAWPGERGLLALSPLADRHAGAREVLWRAIVGRNHGCTHVVVDLPVDARELPAALIEETGVAVTVAAPELRLAGASVPRDLTFPAVAREMTVTHPPRDLQGFTVFFTGFSGSGKSTIASTLLVRLMEFGGRTATLLDGDLLRKHLSSELTFSRRDRDLNIRRIGFVAAEITKHGGIAICAPIAPYAATRADVRRMVEAAGGFVLAHVATPLEVCEERDRKGLYAKARAGEIPEFTGISDPYEVPDDAEIVLDTTHLTAQEAAQQVLDLLRTQGYLLAPRRSPAPPLSPPGTIRPQMPDSV
jgi:sulfate adenylyltransferase